MAAPSPYTNCGVGGYCSSTRRRSAAASSRASTCDASDISSTKIHPSPYGSWFSCSGVDPSATLTSTTVPPTDRVDVRHGLRRFHLRDAAHRAHVARHHIRELDEHDVTDRVLREVGDPHPGTSVLHRDPLVLLRVPKLIRGAPYPDVYPQNLAESAGVLLGKLGEAWSLSPSAQTWVSASSGYGKRGPKPSRMHHLDPVDEHDVSRAGRPARRLHVHTAPYTPRRRHRLVRRHPAREELDDRRDRPLGGGEQVQQLDERTVASNAGMTSGQMNPPSCDAEVDAARRRHLHEMRGRELRPRNRGATLRRTRSASRLTDTSRTTDRPGRFRHRACSTSNARSEASASPSSSMNVAVSPSASMTTPS